MTIILHRAAASRLATEPGRGPPGPAARPRAPGAGRAQDAPAPASNSTEVDLKGHVGPPWPPLGALQGAPRAGGPIHDRFDLARALGDAIFIDGFYRTPRAPLRRLPRPDPRPPEAAGFSAEGSALRLRVVEKEMRAPACGPWPRPWSLGAGADREVLLAFGAPGDAHRTMVPQGKPSVTSRGPRPRASTPS